MSMITHLCQTPLFNGLPKEHLEELVDIVVDQTLARGQAIFSEGDNATGFYIVISGRVKVFKLSADGKEQTLHIFGPGEPFGEVPMFAGGCFPAHAETMEKTRLFFFPRDSVFGLIRREPAFAMNMLAALSRLLRQMTRLIEDLSLKEMPARLAAYLLYLSNREKGGQEVILDITKGQLASLLGTIPETLSRMLGKMSAQGFIEVHHRQITIVNRKGLRDLAAGGKFLV